MLMNFSGTYFFQSVAPFGNYKLRVNTIPGEEIVFDFAPRLNTTRFACLKDPQLFASAATDGKRIIFQSPGVMPVFLSAGEFLELLAIRPRNAV